jgi:multidrug transporter EmrE-like cation transporter
MSVVALSISEIIGDFGFRSFATSGSLESFTQGSLGYVGVIFFLIKAFKTGNVLYVNGMWDGWSAILESLAAFFILGDRLKSWTQYFGLGCIIVGVFLLRNVHR